MLLNTILIYSIKEYSLLTYGIPWQNLRKGMPYTVNEQSSSYYIQYLNIVLYILYTIDCPNVSFIKTM